MRILVAVGVDYYSNLPSLSGAEIDAQNIFKYLTDESFGWHNYKYSRLLLSPTFDDFQSIIGDIFSTISNISMLTVFFAGHGAVQSGSYYLCLSDTNPKNLALTSLPMYSLFALIAEQAPNHTNIIIDACHSASFARDLNVLNKPENMGDFGTPSISVLCTAAADQFAGDTEIGGKGTNALLRYITGECVVPVNRPGIDLLDLGRSVIEELRSEEAGQNAVLWGVNLSTDVSVIRNVNFSTDKEIPGGINELPSSVAIDGLNVEAAKSLWKIYLDVSPDTAIRKLHEVFDGVECSVGSSKNITDLLRNFARALAERNKGGADRFGAPIIMGKVFTYIFVRAIEDNDIDSIEKSCADIEPWIMESLRDTVASIRISDTAFLDRESMLADVCLLPLRLSAILGWIGFGELLIGKLDNNKEEWCSIRSEIIQFIVNDHGGALKIVSESQGQDLACFFAVGLRKFPSDAMNVLRFYINDIFYTQSRYLAYECRPEEFIRYISARGGAHLRLQGEEIARPCETSLILLLFSKLFELEEDVDEFLHWLDHVALNFFVPSATSDYGRVQISGGTNLTFEIGRDVFTVGEVADFVRRALSGEYDTGIADFENWEVLGEILCCLSWRDRLPLSLFRGVLGEDH